MNRPARLIQTLATLTTVQQALLDAAQVELSEQRGLVARRQEVLDDVESTRRAHHDAHRGALADGQTLRVDHHQRLSAHGLSLAAQARSAQQALVEAKRDESDALQVVRDRDREREAVTRLTRRIDKQHLADQRHRDELVADEHWLLTRGLTA